VYSRGIPLKGNTFVLGSEQQARENVHEVLFINGLKKPFQLTFLLLPRVKIALHRQSSRKFGFNDQLIFSSKIVNWIFLVH